MNKTRIVWGIICLVIAVIIGVFVLITPPENLMFQVGNINMPWVPVVVFTIVGIILLAGAGTKEEQAPPAIETKPGEDAEKAAMNKRLESIAWGFFLIMLGGFALIPDNLVPKGAWSIGVGIIMLGLNFARYANKIRMSGFTTVLGILSLIGGIAELVGFTNLNGALLLIILGAYLIMKPWFEKNKLFGKAEQA